jgi:hypothetical protein
VIDKETALTPRDLYLELMENGSITPRNRLEIKPSLNGEIEKNLVNYGWVK